MDMSDTKDIEVFVDGIGRTIVGELEGSDDTHVDVKNPAIVHVQPNPQTGQIQVQLVPFFFKEFAEGDSDTTWSFKKDNLVLGKGVQLDARLLDQYSRMFSAIVTPDAPQVVTPGAGNANSPVVKLFDD
tara:strand:- start:655 stop:1041 length:387 start_codon:yes stop_codon:yes gene_type:complete